MKRSLQTRLLLGTAGGTSMVLVVSGAVLYVLIRAELIAEFDRTLGSEARAIATLVEVSNGRIKTEFSEHGVSKFESKTRPVYYQLWNHEGKLIEQSDGLGSTKLARFGGTAERPEFRPVMLPDNLRGRMAGFRFAPFREHEGEERPSAVASGAGQKTTVTLIVARDTSDLDRTLGRIGMLLAGVFAVAVVLSLSVTAPIVRASLRPLKETSARIESLDTGSLAKRLDAADAPDEVRSVIDCLNGLLSRLHDAFERERAFSANVAHELRTPLAGLRSTIDVALFRPRDASEYRRSFEQCLDICKQAESLMENLLVLARLDTGECKLQHETVELTELLHKLWSPMATRADSRGLKITWRLESEIKIDTDPTLLSLVFRNLLDNAVCYTNTDGHIEVAASATNGTATITVENTASGLPPDLTERVFDRFWRGDLSRSATGQHAGLGLSLCREAARVLDGDLTVTARDTVFATRLQVSRSLNPMANSDTSRPTETSKSQ